MDHRCIFKFRYGKDCDDAVPCTASQGQSRIQSIIQASKAYGDDLDQNLEEQLANDESLILHCHKNCVSKYTTKSNWSKYQTKGCGNPPTKKLRRSHETFDF